MKTRIYIQIVILIFNIGIINAQWERLYGGFPMYTAPIGGITTDPEIPRNIFAGTGNKLFFSSDNGDTWNKVDSFPNDIYPIWSITINKGRIFVSTAGGGILVSKDYGKSWITVLDKATTLEVYRFKCYNDRIYACTGHGLFSSEDNGDTWKHHPMEDYPYFRIKFVAANNEKIYITDSQFVALSSDDGTTWEFFNNIPKKQGSRRINSMYLIDSALIVCYDEILFKTTNDGVKWDTLYDVVKDTVIWDIHQCDNNLFSPTSKAGVLYSSDFGRSWKGINNGLKYYQGFESYLTSKLALNDEYIFVSVGEASTGGQLYRARLSDCEIVTTGIYENSDNDRFSLYPNPASDCINIKAGYSKPGRYDLKILDLLGNPVYREQRVITRASEKVVGVDVEKLPPGMYFLLLECRGKVESKQICIVR